MNGVHPSLSLHLVGLPWDFSPSLLGHQEGHWNLWSFEWQEGWGRGPSVLFSTWLGLVRGSHSVFCTYFFCLQVLQAAFPSVSWSFNSVCWKKWPLQNCKSKGSRDHTLPTVEVDERTQTHSHLWGRLKRNQKHSVEKWWFFNETCHFLGLEASTLSLLFGPHFVFWLVERSNPLPQKIHHEEVHLARD